jgi:riboflavin biosynthesis pyrimidine reductase
MSSEPSAPAPAMLTSLIGEAAGRHLTAARAVERLRLWDPSSPAAPVGERPRVFLNMACTADGRTTLNGRSGPIGNRADRELFHALRTAVDAVLVGAGTVRAERYRRLVRDEAHRQLRRERGLSEEPLACIVSASLTLAPESVPLLADPAARIVILTPSPAGELTGGASSRHTTPDGQPPPGGQVAPGRQATREEQGPPVEYVRAAREGHLDLPTAMAELYTRWGVRTMLCEGGPHLNGALLAAGLVDDLFLSLAPKLGGGAGPRASLRIVCGPELDPPVELELREALESEGCLLLRYAVGGGPGGARRAPMRPRPV